MKSGKWSKPQTVIFVYYNMQECNYVMSLTVTSRHEPHCDVTSWAQLWCYVVILAVTSRCEPDCHITSWAWLTNVSHIVSLTVTLCHEIDCDLTSQRYVLQMGWANSRKQRVFRPEEQQHKALHSSSPTLTVVPAFHFSRRNWYKLGKGFRTCKLDNLSCEIN